MNINIDTALNINGDFDTDSEGMAYRISGNDEIRQKVYILLSARLGEFIYDRTLGSDIHNIDISQPEACDEIIAQARKTLCDIPQIEVTGAQINDGQITVSVQIDGEICDIILRI